MEIIELRNQTASTKISNGDFSCSFSPRTINQGDSIYIKTAMLDTVIQQPQNQINIPEDVVLEFEFLVWEIDHDIYADLQTRKNYIGPKTKADFNLYIGLDSSKNFIVWTKRINLTLPSGVYSPEALATTITRLMVSVNELSYPNDLSGSYNPFFKQLTEFGEYEYPDGSGSYYANVFFTYVDKANGNLSRGQTPFWYNYMTVYQNDLLEPKLMTGAQQIALTFNQNNNNKFEFTYLHTPIYNPNEDPQTFNTTVASVYTVQPANYPTYSFLGIKYIQAHSGIAFTDLQPASFWQSLGFNLDEVVIKLSPDRMSFTNWNFDKQFTYNLMTSADLQISAAPFLYNLNESTPGPIFRTSDSTHPITSQYFISPDPSPIYIIELICNFSNCDYEDSGNISKSVSSICGKGYISSNYIISYQDDSIPYTHTSPIPTVLSSIRVRILDVSTKEVSNNIADNNYIILAIERANPEKNNSK